MSGRLSSAPAAHSAGAAGVRHSALLDYFEELIARTPQLTSSEQKIARYYRQNFPEACWSKIDDVAQASAVSTASVTRFVRKVGFADFKEFSQKLSDVLSRDLKKPAQRLAQLSEQPSDLSQVLRERVQGIAFTGEHLDTEQVERVSEVLADSHRTVYLAAVATGRPLLEYFGLMLSYVRGSVVMLEGPDRWAHQVTDLDSDSVVVISMVNRIPAQLVSLAQLAVARGATVVLVSNHSESTTMFTPDYFLQIPEGNSSGIFTSRASWMLVMDLLLENVAQVIKGHDGAGEALRAQRLEEGFQALGIHRS